MRSPRACYTLALATFLSFSAHLGPAQTPQPSPAGTTAPVTPSPNLAGIAHVAFRVSDLAATLAFYQKLGFTRAFELTTKDGRPSEEFIKLNDRQFIELYPASLAPTEPLGLMHVCYEAADLNAVQAAYTEAGLNPPAVRKAGAGNLLLVLRGPGNVVIEYTQYMPGSLHTRDTGQHLGPNRLATALTGAFEPVQDPAAFQDLFTTRLHFVDQPGTVPAHLRLPGSSSAYVAFVPSATQPHATLILTGSERQRSEAALRKAGISMESSAGAVTLSDPDGNQIVLHP